MHGLNQIHSQNYEAARFERNKYKQQLLKSGKTTIDKLDDLGNIDIDIQPLSFDTPEAARGHLLLHVPVHQHASYLVTPPTV